MIGILVGVAIAIVIAALAVTLLMVARARDKNWELYEIACDDSREWKAKYRALAEKRADERLAREIPRSSILAKSNYHAERDRERRTVANSNELERGEGVG